MIFLIRIAFFLIIVFVIAVIMKKVGAFDSIYQLFRCLFGIDITEEQKQFDKKVKSRSRQLKKEQQLIEKEQKQIEKIKGGKVE